jgi:nicotinate-nucleotide pyrophosphorylase (carboxylating)
MDRLPVAEIQRAVRLALDEDVGSGDATTLATVPPDRMVRAHLVAREPIVLAGVELAEAAWGACSAAIRCERLAEDASEVAAGATLLRVFGPAGAILTGERVALNFVQRLSGIATLTAQYVRAVQDTRVRILDTRKTTPGWRHLEKYAVRCGGGHNHRFGLFDGVLIKDNHLAALAHEKPNAIAAAVRRAREHYPHLPVEVEADNPAQVQQAVEAAPDVILLDNMTLEHLREAVRMVAGRVKLEASGGVHLGSVRAIAQTGVDFVSVGALTHSARAVDLGLDFQSLEEP